MPMSMPRPAPCPRRDVTRPGRPIAQGRLSSRFATARFSLMRLGLLFWMGMGLTLSGCSTMGDWFGGGDGPDRDEEVRAYIEPDPGQPVGLTRVWSVGLAGDPDDYFHHPGVIASHGDRLFVGTFQGEVAAVDRTEGRRLWETDLEAEVGGGVAVDGTGTRVYAGTRNAEMVALDAATGAILWRTAVSAPVSSAPTVAGGRVFFLTLDNRAYALDAVSGERLWVHVRPPEPLVVMGAGAPTAVGQILFVGYASGEVFALSQIDGKPLWSTNLTVVGSRSELDLLQDVDAPIVATARRLFAVNHQGRLVALHPPSGSHIWERTLSSVRRPLAIGESLFVVDVEGNLSALSMNDGLVLWKTRLSDGLLTTPVAFHDRILTGDGAGRLFAVDPASGRVLGLDHLGDDLFADPLVYEGGLFLWTNDGDLVRYD